MIIVPRRSASAPLPPQGGRVADALVQHTCNTHGPVPTPAPGLFGLPPPSPGGGLNTLRHRSATIPIPTPTPGLFGLPPPTPGGGFELLQALPFHTFIVCPPPSHGRFSFAFARPTVCPQAKLNAMACRQAHGRAKVIGLRTKKIHQNVLTLFINTL